MGHRLVCTVSSGRGEAQVCICWVCLRPWHESTNHRHVLAGGLSRHLSENKYSVQQRATRAQHRDRQTAFMHYFHGDVMVGLRVIMETKLIAGNV